MRPWSPPAGPSPGSATCPPGWWSICCWLAACSPSWATGRCGSGCVPAWTASPVATPTASAALTQARRRLGPAPLRALFDLLRGPAAPRPPVGSAWRGLLVCAIDGTTMSVADTPANHRRYTKQPGNHGGSGYPAAAPGRPGRLRHPHLIDAVFGPTSSGETTMTRQLAGSLRAGMLVLADRNFAAAAAHRPHRRHRRPPAGPLQDQPQAAVVCAACTTAPGCRSSAGSPVRVIDAQITITTSAGRAPAATGWSPPCSTRTPTPRPTLVALYHQRWEIETAYLELKSTILGGRVLRARTPAGIDQEVYALLICYQLLRIAMADATAPTRHRPRPGQLHHRPAHRPRPAHPGRRRHRRHRHRPGRHHRPRRAGQPAARPAHPGQPPHRQTRHLQIQRPRAQHQPDQLQGHHQHRHPRLTHPIDNQRRTLTTRHWD